MKGIKAKMLDFDGDCDFVEVIPCIPFIPVKIFDFSYLPF